MSRRPRKAPLPAPETAPKYELRVRGRSPGPMHFEIWQMPSPATPGLSAPLRLAGLGGRNLGVVEQRVLKKLWRSGIELGAQSEAWGRGHAIQEDLALNLGVLFRTLAPMRSRERMRTVAEGIEAMEREEAAYWLGMAIHRRNPRRVLAALRMLLTDPGARQAGSSATGARIAGR